MRSISGVCKKAMSSATSAGTFNSGGAIALHGAPVQESASSASAKSAKETRRSEVLDTTAFPATIASGCCTWWSAASAVGEVAARMPLRERRFALAADAVS